MKAVVLQPPLSGGERMVEVHMTVQDARNLHNEAFAARNPTVSSVGDGALAALVDALTEAKVQVV